MDSRGKQSPPPTSPGSDSLNFKEANNIIGLVVKVKTTFGDEYEGEMFGYDTNSNCIILQEPEDMPNRSYRVLMLPFVENVQVLSVPSADVMQEALQKQFPAINMRKLAAREQQALQKAHENMLRIGVGVSPEAQTIFNALSRTLPCRWDKTTIIVMDEVRIQAPYTVETCSGGQQNTLQQVKRVLEGERKKLKMSV